MSCKVTLSKFVFPAKRYLCLKMRFKGDPLGLKRDYVININALI